MQIELQLQAVGANNNESVDEGCLPAIEWMLQQVRLICATINQSITLSGNQSISQCDASITALGDASLLITPQVQWNSGNSFGFQLEIEMEMEIEMETQWDSKLIVLNIYIQIYPGVSSIIALVSLQLHLCVPLSLSCFASPFGNLVQWLRKSRLCLFLDFLHLPVRLIGSVGVLPRTITRQLPYAISPNCVWVTVHNWWVSPCPWASA